MYFQVTILCHLQSHIKSYLHTKKTILLLSNETIGTGICGNSEMMCHKTALFGRIGAILTILGGILGLIKGKSKMPQAE